MRDKETEKKRALGSWSKEVDGSTREVEDEDEAAEMVAYKEEERAWRTAERRSQRKQVKAHRTERTKQQRLAEEAVREKRRRGRGSATAISGERLSSRPPGLLKRQREQAQEAEAQAAQEQQQRLEENEPRRNADAAAAAAAVAVAAAAAGTPGGAHTATAAATDSERQGNGDEQGHGGEQGTDINALERTGEADMYHVNGSTTEWGEEDEAEEKMTEKVIRETIKAVLQRMRKLRSAALAGAAGTDSPGTRTVTWVWHKTGAETVFTIEEIDSLIQDFENDLNEEKASQLAERYGIPILLARSWVRSPQER